MNARAAIDDTIKLMKSRMMEARRLSRSTFYSHDLGHNHIVEMYDKIVADVEMSETKLSRWLGWMQCSICSWGIMTLDEAKEINRRHA